MSSIGRQQHFLVAVLLLLLLQFAAQVASVRLSPRRPQRGSVLEETVARPSTASRSAAAFSPGFIDTDGYLRFFPRSAPESERWDPLSADSSFSWWPDSNVPYARDLSYQRLPQSVVENPNVEAVLRNVTRLAYHPDSVVVLRLANGVRMLLQQSPTYVSETVVSMIRYGYFKDPPKFGGLTHYVEHMLGCGSKLYRGDESLSLYCAAVGGDANAFTQSDIMSQWCVVPRRSGLEVARRMVDSLVCPVVEPESMVTELTAISNELLVRKQTSLPLVAAIYETTKPGHYTSQPNIGHNIIVDRLLREGTDRVKALVVVQEALWTYGRNQLVAVRGPTLLEDAERINAYVDVFSQIPRNPPRKPEELHTLAACANVSMTAIREAWREIRAGPLDLADQQPWKRRQAKVQKVPLHVTGFEDASKEGVLLLYFPYSAEFNQFMDPGQVVCGLLQKPLHRYVALLTEEGEKLGFGNYVVCSSVELQPMEGGTQSFMILTANPTEPRAMDNQLKMTALVFRLFGYLAQLSDEEMLRGYRAFFRPERPLPPFAANEMIHNQAKRFPLEVLPALSTHSVPPPPDYVRKFVSSFLVPSNVLIQSNMAQHEQDVKDNPDKVHSIPNWAEFYVLEDLSPAQEEMLQFAFRNYNVTFPPLDHHWFYRGPAPEPLKIERSPADAIALKGLEFWNQDFLLLQQAREISLGARGKPPNHSVFLVQDEDSGQEVLVLHEHLIGRPGEKVFFLSFTSDLWEMEGRFELDNQCMLQGIRAIAHTFQTGIHVTVSGGSPTRVLFTMQGVNVGGAFEALLAAFATVIDGRQTYHLQQELAFSYSNFRCHVGVQGIGQASLRNSLASASWRRDELYRLKFGPESRTFADEMAEMLSHWRMVLSSGVHWSVGAIGDVTLSETRALATKVLESMPLGALLPGREVYYSRHTLYPAEVRLHARGVPTAFVQRANWFGSVMLLPLSLTDKCYSNILETITQSLAGKAMRRVYREWYGMSYTPFIVGAFDGEFAILQTGSDSIMFDTHALGDKFAEAVARLEEELNATSSSTLQSVIRAKMSSISQRVFVPEVARMDRLHNHALQETNPFGLYDGLQCYGSFAAAIENVERVREDVRTLIANWNSHDSQWARRLVTAEISQTKGLRIEPEEVTLIDAMRQLDKNRSHKPSEALRREADAFRATPRIDCEAGPKCFYLFHALSKQAPLQRESNPERDLRLRLQQTALPQQ